MAKRRDEAGLSADPARADMTVFDRTGERDRVGLVLGVFAIAREIEKTNEHQRE